MTGGVALAMSIGPISIRSVAKALMSPEGLADPYPIYEELRRRTDETCGANIFADHAGVRAALVHPGLSSDRAPAIARGLSDDVLPVAAPVTEALRSIVAFRDPPGHTRVRRLLTGALSSRAVAQRTDFVERLAREMLDGFSGRGEADLVADLFHPLPARIVAEIVGIPADDHGRFARWAYDIVMYVGSGAADDALAIRTADSVAEMHDYLSGLIGLRRAEPREDLLSAMIVTEDASGQRLTDHEIAVNCLFLMTAGHETATNMLSNGLLALLRHPEAAERVREDDATHAPMVEEILRFESPVQMTARIAERELTVGGADIEQGASVLILFGSANRDDRVFVEPDRFDIDRSDLAHVAFGHGPHWCIGGSLARQEARIVLPMVLRSLPDLELVSDAVAWQPTLNFRGPQSLSARWSA